MKMKHKNRLFFKVRDDVQQIEEELQGAATHTPKKFESSPMKQPIDYPDHNDIIPRLHGLLMVKEPPERRPPSPKAETDPDVTHFLSLLLESIEKSCKNHPENRNLVSRLRRYLDTT